MSAAALGSPAASMRRMDGSGDDALEEHDSLTSLALLWIMMDTQGHEFKDVSYMVSRAETSIPQNIIDELGMHRVAQLWDIRVERCQRAQSDKVD